MKKLSLVVLLAGGISLVNPVMADDGYDDGDYAAPPVAHKTLMSKQKANKQASAKAPSKKSNDVRQYYTDLTVMDDGVYEDCPEA